MCTPPSRLFSSSRFSSRNSQISQTVRQSDQTRGKKKGSRLLCSFLSSGVAFSIDFRWPTGLGNGDVRLALGYFDAILHRWMPCEMWRKTDGYDCGSEVVLLAKRKWIRHFRGWETSHLKSSRLPFRESRLICIMSITIGSPLGRWRQGSKD